MRFIYGADPKLGNEVGSVTEEEGSAREGWAIELVTAVGSGARFHWGRSHGLGSTLLGSLTLRALERAY